MGVHIECYSCLVLANDNWMDVRALLPLVPDAFLLRDFLLASMEPRHQPCPVRRADKFRSSNPAPTTGPGHRGAVGLSDPRSFGRLPHWEKKNFTLGEDRDAAKESTGAGRRRRSASRAARIQLATGARLLLVCPSPALYPLLVCLSPALCP